MDFTRYTGIIGILLILLIAYALSNNRSAIKLHIVVWGMLLQFVFALLILKTPLGLPIFDGVDKGIRALLSFSEQGSDLLFKSFVTDKVEPSVVSFAFRILPTIIFFSSLISALYYLGIMQRIVAVLAIAMQKTLGTSGAETLTVAANIFVGQTEAPLLVKPYLENMTRSELMAMMTGGFATVAGGVLAIYVSLLKDIPGIAGHLMTASVMSAPATFVVAKIMVPETEQAPTQGNFKIETVTDEANLIEAISNGATDGMKLAINVAAMLIAFVSLIALLNAVLATIGLSLEKIFGVLFFPLAWAMGVPYSDAMQVGILLGQKTVLTEMIAYINLSAILHDTPQLLSHKAQIIASYALCGFANFASIGVQIGGISAIAPSRRKDLSELGMPAMIAGTLASCLTGAIAGMLIE